MENRHSIILKFNNPAELFVPVVLSNYDDTVTAIFNEMKQYGKPNAIRFQHGLLSVKQTEKKLSKLKQQMSLVYHTSFRMTEIKKSTAAYNGIQFDFDELVLLLSKLFF